MDMLFTSLWFQVELKESRSEYVHLQAEVGALRRQLEEAKRNKANLETLIIGLQNELEVEKKRVVEKPVQVFLYFLMA